MNKKEENENNYNGFSNEDLDEFICNLKKPSSARSLKSKKSQRHKSYSSESDSVQIHLRQIARHRLLTGREEIELSRNARKGHQASINQLVQGNLRLVVSIARRYMNQGMPFLDLIQEGSIGLITAAKKFDPEKGYKFSTYATWWIRQAITRALSNKSRTIRVPVHMVATVHKLKKDIAGLCQKLNRIPTLDEIAKESGLSADKVIMALKAHRNLASLDAPVIDGSDFTLSDMLADKASLSPEEIAHDSLVSDKVRILLSTLNARERDVIKMRFGLDTGVPLSLGQVGKVLDLSRERVRQIEAIAFKKLKRRADLHKFKDLLN